MRTLLAGLVMLLASAGAAASCGDRTAPVFDGQIDFAAVHCQVSVLKQSLSASVLARELTRAENTLASSGLQATVNLSADQRATLQRESWTEVRAVNTACAYWSLVAPIAETTDNRQVREDIRSLESVCYRYLGIALRQEMMNWQEAGRDDIAGLVEQDLLALESVRNRHVVEVATN